MNKLVRAAVVGGAALAVGLLPTIGVANAAMAPTPIPVPVSPTASATVGTSGHAPAHQPGHRKTTKHRKSTKRKRRPTTGGVVGKRGKGTGGRGAAKSGAHRTHRRSPRQPVGHRPVRKPVTTQPVTKQPITKQPVGKKPVTKRPGQRKPVGHQPVRPVGRKPVVSPTRTPVAPTVPTKPRPTNTMQDKRIIGGKIAGNAPWAVQVNWDDTGFECSGSAVAPQWVLTAGHCAGSGGMTVLIGSNELGQGTQATVDQKIVDPTGDLALLHLSEPVQTTYVQLADTDPKVGAIDQIYGFGKTDPNSGPSQELKVAKVKVTSVDCQDGVQGKAICSTGINGAAFNGDSGGPELEKGVEVGVCSTGDPTTKTQEYASVAANRDWIQQIANV